MDGTRTSQDGDNTLNPPPFPPTLADAIAALVNATTLLAQNQNGNQGRRGRNNGGETTYVDFTNTRPPVFSKADEPLEADVMRTSTPTMHPHRYQYLLLVLLLMLYYKKEDPLHILVRN
jgi:hypothetical protein